MNIPRTSSFRLDGERVLVAGGSSGIVVVRPALVSVAPPPPPPRLFKRERMWLLAREPPLSCINWHQLDGTEECNSR